MDDVLPLEQTDPELAELLRQIVAGHESEAFRTHPVRYISASWHTRIYGLWTHDHWGYPTEIVRKSRLPGRNDACPCGSGRKMKKCCRQ